MVHLRRQSQAHEGLRHSRWARGWYPDVCIPLSQAKYGNGFAIPSQDFHTPDSERFCEQKNQAIWVDIHIPPKTPPGLYKGQIQVRNSTGASQAVQVQLKVWDFAIPAEMHMIAHLVNYGETTVQESDPVMYAYYRMAAEHRTYINDDKVIPAEWDGKQYDWKTFDKRFGPMFDGSAFKKGPTAGVPIPAWAYPINFHIESAGQGQGVRHDARTGPWPVEKSAEGLRGGVHGRDPQALAEAMRKFEEHFVEKGWTKTKIVIYQDSLDEPGFWMQGEKLKAGEQQAQAHLRDRQDRQAGGLKQFRTASTWAAASATTSWTSMATARSKARWTPPSTSDRSRRSGTSTDCPSRCPPSRCLKKMGDAVCFYNGFEPRVGSNALPAELLGLRQWSVAAYRSGLAGWVDWQFRVNRDVPVREANGRRPGVLQDTEPAAAEPVHLPRRCDRRAGPGLRLDAAQERPPRCRRTVEMLRLLTIKDGSDKRAQQLADKVCQATFLEVGVNMKEDDAPGEKEKTAAGFGAGQHWSHDPAAWEQFRRALGEALTK